MVDEKEVYLVCVELHHKREDEGWDDNLPAQWVVNKFYNYQEAVEDYYKYRNLEDTRSIALTVPVQSMDWNNATYQFPELS